MGPNLLYHLGGGQGGIAHFFKQFTGPMIALWRGLRVPQSLLRISARTSSAAFMPR